MGCSELLSGLDITCKKVGHRYYQNVVIVNIADVDQYSIFTNNKNNIHFNLFAGKTGFLFASNKNVNLIDAKFSKSVKKNINYYSHSVTLPVIGVEESIKLLLRQLDEGHYFAAVQFVDGTVEIYGFNYGLKPTPYTYEAQNGMGGIQITLKSTADEYYPPYIYIPKILKGGNTTEEQANQDFNDLFADIPVQFTGDFNNDYNLDFYITN